VNVDWFSRIVGALVVLGIAAVVGLIGYGIWYEVNDPGHGTITRKQYHPAYWTQSCSTVGKSTICTPLYHADCYSIEYTDGRHDGDACVSPHEYETYQVGEQYPHTVAPPKEPAQ
jgi:hypothetical protein